MSKVMSFSDRCMPQPHRLVILAGWREGSDEGISQRNYEGISRRNNQGWKWSRRKIMLFFWCHVFRVISPPNWTPRRFPSYLLLTLLLYFLSIFYFRRCTLPDFPSIFSLASLPFLPCCHWSITTTFENSDIFRLFFINFFVSKYGNKSK